MSLPYKVYSVQEIQNIAVQYDIPMKEVCRFFIGEDYRGPKAYGIYFDEGIQNWVVYKNKANADRAIRYSGISESEAAQIIWDKFLEEVRKRPDIARVLLYNEYPDGYSEQERNDYARESYNGYEPNKKKRSGLKTALIATGVGIGALAIIGAVTEPSRGYYRNPHNNREYYYLDNDWYYYNSLSDTWVYIDDIDHSDFEYLGEDYYDAWEYSYDIDFDFGTSFFEDTTYYKNWEFDEYYGNDWDSDDDWDSGWDSGSDWGSDWDSDW